MALNAPAVGHTACLRMQSEQMTNVSNAQMSSQWVQRHVPPFRTALLAAFFASRRSSTLTPRSAAVKLFGFRIADVLRSDVSKLVETAGATGARFRCDLSAGVTLFFFTSSIGSFDLAACVAAVGGFGVVSD